jgi:hypothetical protein
MRVFLDFEASSLGDDSYPIEVGWVFEDGAEESHLIRPAPDWTDWDAGAEAMHHIGREDLMARGETPVEVAGRVLDVLAPHAVYVSAPSWDGKWLSVLLRAGGFPRHAMRLRDSDEAMIEAAREGLASVYPPERLDAAAADLVEASRRAAHGRPIVHRALDDARQERALWLEIRDKAAARGRQQSGT